MEFCLAAARLRPVGDLSGQDKPFSLTTAFSVHFPGVVNSKFVTELAFERPSTRTAMPTYRVMDSDGVIVDERRTPSDIKPEEVIMWYKNMLTGTIRPY